MNDEELAKVLSRGVEASPPPFDRVLDAPRRRVRIGITAPVAAVAAIAAVVLVIATRTSPTPAPSLALTPRLDRIAMSLPGTPDLLEADRIAQRILAIRTEPTP